MKRQHKSFKSQGKREKTQKTHNVINLTSSNDKNIAFDSNLTSIDNNTSINSTKKSNKNINSFLLALQEAIFD